MYSLSSWTLRNNHGCRLDPKPTAESSSYAINVDSKAALLAIANNHISHPLAVATRLKTTELRNSTSITFHWVKGHVGLNGKERADYLAKIAASYNTTIAYDAIPINRGKRILEDYYIKIWNAAYINPTLNCSYPPPSTVSPFSSGPNSFSHNS